MKKSDILATFLLVSITFSPASFAGQLQRFATVPIKAEVTGLYIREQGDLFFNVQHPSGSIDPPFNRAMIGYVKDVDFSSRTACQSVSDLKRELARANARLKLQETMRTAEAEMARKSAVSAAACIALLGYTLKPEAVALWL